MKNNIQYKTTTELQIHNNETQTQMQMEEFLKKTLWSDILTRIFQKYPLLDDICLLQDTLPERKDIFKAFTFFDINNLRVVIIGQDPYQNRPLANGLCFSVPSNTKLPPSLRNIFKELNNCGIQSADAPQSAPQSVSQSAQGTPSVSPRDTDLSDWAKQGVLLLNTALTVKENEAGSHTKHWKHFTADLISYIANNSKNVVYMLWGNHAQSYIEYINIDNNLVLTHTHPSPLSRKPFVDNGHFKRCNLYLQQHGFDEIRW